MIFNAVVISFIFTAFIALVVASPIDLYEITEVDWSQVRLGYLVPGYLGDILDEIGIGLKFSPTTFEERRFSKGLKSNYAVPYQVGLLAYSPSGVLWCSGALVTNQHILTAAHCVDSADKATIFLGANSFHALEEDGRVAVPVSNENFIIHDEWNRSDMLNDIALVKLPSAIKNSDKIHPINLPTASKKTMLYDSEPTFVSGWHISFTANKVVFGLLQRTQTFLTEKEICERYYSAQLGHGRICAAGNLIRLDDPGAPLTIDDSIKYTLVGLYSYGINFKSNNLSPTVYTDVSFYVDWIIDKLN